MKIDNHTGWDTRALKTIATRAVRGEFRPDDVRRATLHVVYSRTAQVSGWAYIGSSGATVRVPRPQRARWDKTPGLRKFPGALFAGVVVHEFLHALRALDHKDMGGGRDTAMRGCSDAYDWAEKVEVKVRQPSARPKVTPIQKAELALLHARVKAKEWKSKEAAAGTRRKNWERRCRRAEARVRDLTGTLPLHELLVPENAVADQEAE